jgi:hypothetical protein
MTGAPLELDDELLATELVEETELAEEVELLALVTAAEVELPDDVVDPPPPVVVVARVDDDVWPPTLPLMPTPLDESAAEPPDPARRTGSRPSAHDTHPATPPQRSRPYSASFARLDRMSAPSSTTTTS